MRVVTKEGRTMNLMPVFISVLLMLPVCMVILLMAGPYWMIGFALAFGMIQAVRLSRANR